MWSAFPNVNQTLELRSLVNKKLIDSFYHIFDVVGYGNHCENYLSNAQSHKLSGMLHIIHAAIIQSIELDDEYMARSLIDMIPSIPVCSENISIINFGFDKYDVKSYELYKKISEKSFFTTYGYELDIRSASKDQFIAAFSAIAMSLDRLSIVDKNLYYEAISMISDILLINSNHMNAGSSIYSLGIIRVSQLRDGQNWTRYFETLAHETGHQFLNAIWTLDPLIENEGDNLFTSPLRKEPRPLSGIFHAALVLARTIRSIHSLQSHISYDPHNDQINSSYNNKQNPSGFHDKFIDCCTVLDKHAIFSSQGQHIYDEIKEFVGGIYNV